MHIYAQRPPKHPTESPSNLIKSRSLQSFQDTSPRGKDKSSDQEKNERNKKEKLEQNNKKLQLKKIHQKKKLNKL